jgi:anti-sigma factor RsiW
MNHDEVIRLLGAYLDGELDLTTCVKIEEHIAGCESCRQKMEAEAELIETVRSETPRFEPSPFLATRIRASVREQAGEKAPSRKRLLLPWVWSGLAIAAAAILMFGYFWSPGLPGIVREAVADHVRSLQVNHLMDVASTDQHTVKPWFAGKLNYSPQVIDLTASGYPLAGGRLDILDGQTVAAIIYGRRKHYINLFIWPSNGRPVPTPPNYHNRYNVHGWTKAGMNYLAVSELGEQEFEDFAKLIQQQTSPTRPGE